MNRILLIDDNKEKGEFVTDYLMVEGFEVKAVFDKAIGLQAALKEKHDLVIWDVMNPQKNGFDLLRNLREKSRLPVMILTAKGDVMERIVCLEIGADDYLPKPFNPRELVARLRAILRRTVNAEKDQTPSHEKHYLDEIEILVQSRSAKQNGKDLDLTGIEFNLLMTFVKNAGEIIKKEDLSQELWGRTLSPLERSLEIHISHLRKKLNNNRIKNIRAVGYIYTIQ